jgi:hypothetical protein
MPSFVCDKCHTIENTACGWWWSKNKNQRMLGKQYPDGEAYCSVCTPVTFSDGSINEKAGKWHNRFDQKKADKDWVVRAIKSNNLATPLNQAIIDIIGSKEEVERLFSLQK